MRARITTEVLDHGNLRVAATSARCRISIAWSLNPGNSSQLDDWEVDVARIAGIPGYLAQFYGAVCPSSPRSISISSDDSDQDSSHQSNVEAHHTCLQMMTRSTLRSTRRKPLPKRPLTPLNLAPTRQQRSGEDAGAPSHCMHVPSQRPDPQPREGERESP